MARPKGLLEDVLSEADQIATGKLIINLNFRWEEIREEFNEKIWPKYRKGKNGTRRQARVSEKPLRLFSEQVVWPAFLRRRASIGDRALGIIEEKKSRPYDWLEVADEMLSKKIAEVSMHDDLSADDLKTIGRLFGPVLKKKDLEIRRESLELARQQWEFSAAKSAMTHAAKIREISGSSDLTANEKTEAVRAILFGADAPDSKPLTGSNGGNGNRANGGTAAKKAAVTKGKRSVRV